MQMVHNGFSQKMQAPVIAQQIIDEARRLWQWSEVRRGLTNFLSALFIFLGPHT